jgi:hypothetical protein
MQPQLLDSPRYDLADWQKDYTRPGRVEPEPVRGPPDTLGVTLGVLTMLGWGVVALIEWLLASAPWNGGLGVPPMPYEILIGVPLFNVAVQLVAIFQPRGLATRAVAVPIASMFLLVPWIAIVMLRFGGIGLLPSVFGLPGV